MRGGFLFRKRAADVGDADGDGDRHGAFADADFTHLIQNGKTVCYHLVKILGFK